MSETQEIQTIPQRTEVKPLTRRGIKKNYRRKLQEAKEQATIDNLTKLPNRAFFDQEVATRIREFERNNQDFYLLFMDIKDFKGFNSYYTHDGGDKLLQIFGTINEKITRPRETFMRLGGDEFVQLVDSNISEEDLGIITQRNQQAFQEEAKKVISSLKVRQDLSQEDAPQSSSIQVGVVKYVSGMNTQNLVRNGSEALLRAKTTTSGVVLTNDGSNFHELGKIT